MCIVLANNLKFASFLCVGVCVGWRRVWGSSLIAQLYCLFILNFLFFEERVSFLTLELIYRWQVPPFFFLDLNVVPGI